MTRDEVENAILNARRGIARYAEIMNLFPTVDVSSDRDFQRKYNGFYRVQRRKEEWYQAYYSLMQGLKGKPVSFDLVIDKIFDETNRVEPSFSSKLVATLNPKKPVWDIYVLQNTKHKAPSYANKARITLIKTAYRSIEQWYEKFLDSADGRLCVKIFDEKIPEHKGFTDLKKVDFVLWQTRPPRSK